MRAQRAISLGAHKRRDDFGDGDVVRVRNRRAGPRIAVERARERGVLHNRNTVARCELANARRQRRRGAYASTSGTGIARRPIVERHRNMRGVDDDERRLFDARQGRRAASARCSARRRPLASASPSSSFASRLRSSKLMRSLRSHALRAAPYSASAKISPTARAIANATRCGADHTSCTIAMSVAERITADATGRQGRDDCAASRRRTRMRRAASGQPSRAKESAACPRSGSDARASALTGTNDEPTALR